MKLIIKLLKKDVKFEWKDEGKPLNIKDSIGRSPMLISLDYSKDFQIFSFTSEDTIAGVLLQKNEEGQEQPLLS
jgi:hypothetical protein